MLTVVFRRYFGLKEPITSSKIDNSRSILLAENLITKRRNMQKLLIFHNLRGYMLSNSKSQLKYCQRYQTYFDFSKKKTNAIPEETILYAVQALKNIKP